MADLSLKNLDDGLMARVKVAAFVAGKTQRDFVVGILEREVSNGDDERGSGRVEPEDFGKGPHDGGGVEKETVSGNEAGGISKGPDVPGLRDGVRERSDVGARGSHVHSRAVGGSVGRGAQKNRAREGSGEGGGAAEFIRMKPSEALRIMRERVQK
jgi:hypothetical protein